MLFRTDEATLTSTAQRQHKLFMGQGIHFLLNLALHIGFAGGAVNVKQPRTPHIAVYDLASQTKIVQQSRKRAGRMFELILLFKNKLLKRFEVAQFGMGRIVTHSTVKTLWEDAVGTTEGEPKRAHTNNECRIGNGV